MSRVPSPLLLGFDEIERAFERVARSASDGYPPYNVERIAGTETAPETLRIVLAVAGFSRAELEIAVEEGQLVIRGRQAEARARVYLHRGIATRQFSRVFLHEHEVAAMPILTKDQLATLGEGLIAYVKPIRSDELGAMFPEAPDVQPGLQLFALLGASGKPLIVTDSRDAALANAMQHELHMVSLH